MATTSTPVRDGLLRSHAWNFAIELATVSKMTDDPAFGWKYQYAMPADCLRILPLTKNGMRNGASLRYEIIGRTIQTDEISPIKIRYIKRVEDDAMFDASFTELLGVMLAMRMAHFLTGKQSYVERLKVEAQTLMNHAPMIDGMEGTPEDPEQSTWVTGRETGIEY
jgi:hypothetical protein